MDTSEINSIKQSSQDISIIREKKNQTYIMDCQCIVTFGLEKKNVLARIWNLNHVMDWEETRNLEKNLDIREINDGLEQYKSVEATNLGIRNEVLKVQWA